MQFQVEPWTTSATDPPTDRFRGRIGLRGQSEVDPDTGEMGGSRGVIVLGAHRGGTSAVAGLLAGAGFGLGADDSLPADPHNPLGYFELASILQFNEGQLSRCGGSWDCPPALEAVASVSDEGRSEVLRRVDALAQAALPAPLVVKDPRIPHLLPIWEPVIGDLLQPVLVVRNPLETAMSLADRDNMSLSAGLALWELTWSRVLSQLQGRSAYLVRYEDLVEGSDESESLIGWARDGLLELLAERVHPPDTSSLRGDLRRRRSSDGVADFATPSQLALWDYLASLKSGPMVIETDGGASRPTSACLITIRRDWETRRRLRSLEQDAACVPALKEHNEQLLAAAQEQAARVRYLSERVEVVSLERDQRGEQIAQLQPLADEARLALAEREALRTSASEALERLRETTAAMDALKLEVATSHAHVEEASRRLLDVYRSETWRVGSAILRPLARVLRRGAAPPREQ